MDRDFASRWVMTIVIAGLLADCLTTPVAAQTAKSGNAPSIASPSDLAPPSLDPSLPPRLDPPVPPGREVEVPEVSDDELTDSEANSPDVPAIEVPKIRPSELEPSVPVGQDAGGAGEKPKNSGSDGKAAPPSRVKETLQGEDAQGMISEVTSQDERDGILPKVIKDAERAKSGVKVGLFKLPALQAANTTPPTGEANRAPESFSDRMALVTEPLPESGADRSPDWHWSVRTWAAANTFSNPRYFEDRMLERHGHERWGHFQSVASGARFFATFPMMPYLWSVTNPCECEYTLGYLRSGSCVPVMLQRPPYEHRAVVVEAATISGLIVGFP